MSRAPRRRADGFGPAGIRIRMYRVGFGDFFLLSVRRARATPRHILIDCGVHAKNLHAIGPAIARLAADCGGALALVVMTHRHADHISGFASGAATFAGIAVERVWMPWFEDPADPVAASIRGNLAVAAQRFRLGLALRAGPVDTELMAMVGNLDGAVDEDGNPLTGNDAALAVLHGGFKAPPPPIDYYRAGDAARLPASLIAAGLSADILGPPSDLGLIAQMDAPAHQYLGVDQAATARQPFAPAYATGPEALPETAFALAARADLEAQVAACQPDLLAAAIRRADNSLNNQSLVIRFGFGGKSLLFAGDAQWGSWQNILFSGALGTPGHEALTPAAAAMLGGIDFYKVGHHGSTNATPVDALVAMRDGCAAMCSTAVGAYGSVENHSEVPRGLLLAALDGKTGRQVARSDQVAAGDAPAIDAPLAAAFTAGDGFIDYPL